MCPNFGTPKIMNFKFRTNENFIIFGFPNTEALYGSTYKIRCANSFCAENLFTAKK